MTDPNLTTDQLNALESALRDAEGRANAVSSAALAERFVPSDTSGSPKTREAIKHLMRERGLPVIGGSDGYYIPESNAEISENVQSLQERIAGIKERQRLLVDNWAAHTGATTDGGTSEWAQLSEAERQRVDDDPVLEKEDFR